MTKSVPPPPIRVVQTVHAVDTDGTRTTASRFASWSSATATLVLWAEADVAPLAVDGARLQIEHADYSFDGVVTARWDLYDGQQVAVTLDEHEEPDPAVDAEQVVR